MPPIHVARIHLNVSAVYFVSLLPLIQRFRRWRRRHDARRREKPSLAEGLLLAHAKGIGLAMLLHMRAALIAVFTRQCVCVTNQLRMIVV